MSEDTKIRYAPFSIRLHEETREQLIRLRVESGLSWNKFINMLLNKYENETRELQEMCE